MCVIVILFFSVFNCFDTFFHLIPAFRACVIYIVCDVYCNSDSDVLVILKIFLPVDLVAASFKKTIALIVCMKNVSLEAVSLQRRR